MRHLFLALSLLLSPAFAAEAQVSVSIGINVPAYPRLVRVPDFPVYYDPDLRANLFFYDGEYWVFQDDRWYASVWYNGPWQWVDPDEVPLFLLRVPVRYYRLPPPYFRGWSSSAPPRWGERWGRTWEERHRDWNRWDRRAVPRPAPLPSYQRPYSRDRYPRELDRQNELRSQHYRYQPREPVTRQHFQQPREQGNQERRSSEPRDRGQPNAPPDRGRQDNKEHRR